MKRRLFLSLLLLMGTLAPAETLRGPLKGELLPDGPALPLEMEDLVQITLPPDIQFTKALEIEVQIPRDLIPYRSNMAVYVYQNLVPGKQESTGDRVALEVLPPGGKFYLQVPLVPKAGLKASIDTAIVKVSPPADRGFPLALAIMPLDKGIPADLQRAQFLVKTRLLNNNLGALNIQTPNLGADQRKVLKISVNGQVQPSEGPILMEPGLVRVELSLPGYKTLLLNAAVSQAKVSDITAIFEEEKPQVLFEAPEGTQIVLDGKKIAWKPLTPLAIEKGIHQVQFILGGYQVTDNFEILTGGAHKVSLVLKVQTEEDFLN